MTTTDTTNLTGLMMARMMADTIARYDDTRGTAALRLQEITGIPCWRLAAAYRRNLAAL